MEKFVDPITVVVVGLGIAGLAVAIDCKENGHKVIAYEKADVLKPIGDCVGIANNGSRVIQSWGNGALIDELNPWRSTAKGINISNSRGRRIMRQEIRDPGENMIYCIPRFQLLRIMYNYAVRIGIEMHLGVEVRETHETEHYASVTVADKRVMADCVICCDGVHSKIRSMFFEQNTKLQTSGYAAFRALVDGKLVAADPKASWILDGSDQEDRFEVFFVNGAQLALQTSNRGKEVAWYCLHKDTSPTLASWTSPVDPDEVYRLMKDWPIFEKLWPIVRHTPTDKFINYPLFVHEPLSTWVSPRGRVFLAGDAAHAMSPAAGQGASQGMEDAAVVSTCLKLAGKSQVPTALRIVEKIRYPRATAIQTKSYQANEAWRHMDWEAYDENQQIVAKLPLEEWIDGHDAGAYTRANFESIAEAVRKGLIPAALHVPVAELAPMTV